MKKSRKNTVFNINNLLISAFHKKKNFADELIFENNEAKKYVDQDLVKDFENIKNGNFFKIKQENDITNELVISLYSNSKFERCFAAAIHMYKKTHDLKYAKTIVLSLLKIKNSDKILKKFISILEEHIDEDADVLYILAEVYFVQAKYEKAKPLYEKIIEKYANDKNSFSIYYKLSYVYERIYQDKYLDKQIELCKKTIDIINNDPGVTAFLAKLYAHQGNIEKAKKLYSVAYKNAMTPDVKMGYSHFLMSIGEITKGYDIYRDRFESPKVTYPKVLTQDKRWDGIADLSDKTVIVHFEQGFGDSVMFSRYVPDIAKLAKKVVFVVQKNLIPLYKSSGYEKYCELLSHEADVNPKFSTENGMGSVMFSTGNGMIRIPHDYQIPLADTPYLFKESPDKMLHSEGYLKADPEKIEAFRKKYIKKNNKIKIGIAYHGTDHSIQTYRDIQVKKFMPLFKMKDLEFYSFQVDAYSKEVDRLDKSLKVHNLKPYLKTFEDTACAMNCMDLIISTDNVVMNLAGALGLKTYGIFNIYPEGRWFKTEGKDVGWYKSVRPFKAKTFNDWNNVIKDIQSAIIKDFNLKKPD